MKDPKKQKPTRANNRSSQNKEQSLTRKITIILVVILILALLFLVYALFGGGGNEGEDSFVETSSSESSLISEESSETESSSESSSESESSSSESSSEESSEEEEESESAETESVEAEGENVEEAYTGDWEPVGTEQTGEHTTDYSEGSQDRIEIKQAISVATGISENDLIEWWVGNAGDDQVEATVSNSDQTENYRVLLNWVDNQGWQPTLVERLNSNPYN